MKNIKVVDTTIRDAHQSLWATRMTTPMMLPIIDQLKNAGYDTVDLMAMVHFDACVRYLKEDPWERIRIISDRLKGGPKVGGWMRSGVFGFDRAPDDLREQFIKKMVDNGVNRIASFDGLLDIGNLSKSVNHTKRCGAEAVAALVFSESPVHTDELYVQKTIELLEETDLDSLMIKDAGGLLTPERVKTLVPALKEVLGKIPLELHTHCPTGLGPNVYIEGIKQGVDVIHTAVSALANDISNPSIQNVSNNLRELDYELNISEECVNRIDNHFREVAKIEGFPLGELKEYNSFHYKHQIPGGMMTNMLYQLEQAGISDKKEQVLEEIAIIREELAYPIMVTPYSQFIGTQAVLNVIHGERYKVVPDEIKKYALGYYGELMGKIDNEIYEKIIESGSKHIPMQPKSVKNVMPKLRQKYSEQSDEEILLRYIIKGDYVDEMIKKGPIKHEYFNTDGTNSVEKMIQRIISKTDFKVIKISTDSIKLTLGA